MKADSDATFQLGAALFGVDNDDAMPLGGQNLASP